MSDSLEPLHIQLQSQDIPLDEIFLDPNNPRFVGLESPFVPDSEIDSADAQKSALNILEKSYGIDKLRMNMEINGYLPIDRIVVRPFGDGSKFVVLEGNRRIAAAKTLPKYTPDGKPIDSRVLESIEVIPALVYSGEDDSAAWLFQGLRHITGISDWSAYNKARLLVEQMEKEQLSLTGAGRRFGLTAFGAGQWVRSYYAFKQAKEQTDYVSEVDEKLYPYVQEVFGRSSIHMRDWLGWDEGSRTFKNTDLLNEFVGWFYPRTEDGETTDDVTVKGEWEKKRLGSRDDIRQLSYMIQHSPKNFQLFRGGLDFDAAYGQAMIEEYEKKKEGDEDAAKAVFDTIEKATKSLNDIPLIMVKNAELHQKLRERLELLSKAIQFVQS